ncbi:MAG TPA: hypothetical protein EYN96_03925 [Candidatus Hydrogenedentes bacterium]|nr:hypothetical protein [Candidatus Hydrogenedentota bacterium]
MKKTAKLIFNLVASHAVTVVLLVFMFLIILFGTLYQVDNGLYAAQQKYFDSVFVLHQIGPITIPLPGAYTLLVLVAVNLVFGGFIRIRKNRYTAGVLITHFGIAFMLVSCALTFHFANRGHMRLYETQSSNEFVSYVDWAIEIGGIGDDQTLHVIQDTEFSDLTNGKTRVFHNADLPFELKLSDYSINSWVNQERDVMPTNSRIVDGFFLDNMKPDLQAERNAPGVYVEITDKETQHATEGILWGYSNAPLTVMSGDQAWLINLTRKRWSLPFKVTLDEFIHEQHAGTGMAKSFESYITKTKDGKEDIVRIWMNHPLRHDGYTFFQESWSPPNPETGEPLYSQFAVVRNPGDQGPLYACIIVSIGLLFHFTQKLLAYMRIEAKRRTS